MKKLVIMKDGKKLIEKPCECPFRDVQKNKCNNSDNEYVKKCSLGKFPIGCPLLSILSMDEIEYMKKALAGAAVND